MPEISSTPDSVRGFRLCLIEAGEGVVIGDPQNAHSRLDRFLDQLRGRAGAVRFVGVRV